MEEDRMRTTSLMPIPKSSDSGWICQPSTFSRKLDKEIIDPEISRLDMARL